jgi:hypothetical protein
LETSENKQIAAAIDSLDQRLLVADENGMFRNQRVVTFTDCQAPLMKSRTLLKAGKSDEAIDQYHLASNKFNEAIESSDRWWKISYRYGIPWFLYQVAALALVAFYSFQYSSVSPESSQQILWVPVWILGWGATGAIVRSLWYLWFQINRKVFRKDWLVWFVSSPILGALLGALVYMLFLAGLLATTQANVKEPWFPMVLAGLAGFSWEWATEILKKMTDVIGVSKTKSA